MPSPVAFKTITMTEKLGGNHFKSLSLIAIFSLLAVLHRVRDFSEQNHAQHNAYSVARNQKKKVNRNISRVDPLVNSISFNDLSSQPSIENEISLSLKSATQKRVQVESSSFLKPSNIPVYTTDLSDVYSMDYHYLASIWDRETQYDDMLHASKNSSATNTQQETQLRHQLHQDNRNITVIFHNSPKTASSTLREACLETQYDTCNLPLKPPGNHWPEGYRTPKRLTQLFNECPNTHHFCVRGHVNNKKLYTLSYHNRTFLHLFPFRNYDEWVASAMNQISKRDGEEGCQYTLNLVKECQPHKYELNFERYTKFILSEFISSYRRVRKRNSDMDVNGHHHVLIYNYLHLDETLTWLHERFGVPLLAGTAKKMNTAPPDFEPCKDAKLIMRKFHDCFSESLARLY